MGLGHEEYHWYSPTDKDTALICGGDSRSPYRNLQSTQFYPASRTEELEPPMLHENNNIGHFFHAHCWKLFVQILGEEVRDRMVGRIVQAARQYWQIGLSEVLSSERPWANSDIDVFFWAHQLDRAEYTKYQDYFWGCKIYRSPLIVPEVQDLIQMAGLQGKRWKSPYLNTRIPLEICHMVMEIICPLKYTRQDLQDTRNMLSVFLVDIPESFWKRRLGLNLDFLLELDLLEKVDIESLDLQVLWIGLMGLLSHPLWPASGLATRQRILPLMKEILVNFHELEKR